MAQIAGYQYQAVGDSNGGNLKIRMSDWGSLPLQLGPQGTVVIGRIPAERKNGDPRQENLIEPLEVNIGCAASPSAVDDLAYRDGGGELIVSREYF